MPSGAKKLDRAVAKLPSIPKELVDQFLTGPMTEAAINAAGLAFKQALIEASLNAELTHHLGYAPGADRPESAANQRNGVTAKTVLIGDGRVRIERWPAKFGQCGKWNFCLRAAAADRERP